MYPMWNSSQGFTRRENECAPQESNLGAQYSSPRKQMVGFSWAYTISTSLMVLLSFLRRGWKQRLYKNIWSYLYGDLPCGMSQLRLNRTFCIVPSLYINLMWRISSLLDEIQEEVYMLFQVVNTLYVACERPCMV